MSLALAILSLPITLYLAIRLYDKVKQDAMTGAMTEIGRNLIHQTAHLSRSHEARVALEEAGAALMAGRFVSGADLARKIKGGRE
jgi:sensor histidine kinase regulating citrate/malate metabolism